MRKLNKYQLQRKQSTVGKGKVISMSQLKTGIDKVMKNANTEEQSS